MAVENGAEFESGSPKLLFTLDYGDRIHFETVGRRGEIRHSLIADQTNHGRVRGATEQATCLTGESGAGVVPEVGFQLRIDCDEHVGSVRAVGCGSELCLREFFREHLGERISAHIPGVHMRIPSRVIPSVSTLVVLLLVAPLAAQVVQKKGDPALATKGKATVKKAVETGGKREPAPIPFAVVDMEKAATHTKAFKKGMAEGAKQAQMYQKDIEGMKSQVKSFKLEIEMMVVSPERMQKELEREALLGKLSLAGKMYNTELERQKVLNDDKIYQEVSVAVAELAARRGILLVLRKHPHLTIKEMLARRMARSAASAMNRQILANRQRGVIYHAPDLDITEDLIKYLKAK